MDEDVDEELRQEHGDEDGERRPDHSVPRLGPPKRFKWLRQVER